jgi:AcrR family transcriptional regulator
MLDNAGLESPIMRKGAKTRAHLIKCAIAVFSRKGVDGAAISEITQEADVANGTYYNHFRDKAEIVSATVNYIMTELFAEIHELMDPNTPAAERVSFTTRQFILLAVREREWGLTMFRALASVPELRHSAARYVLSDLVEGEANGQFNVKVDDFLGNMVATMNMLAVFSCLRGDEVPTQVGPRIAEYQLRLLGLSKEESARIAWMPLPKSAATEGRRNLKSAG